MLDTIHEHNIDKKRRIIYCLYEAIDSVSAAELVRNLNYLNRSAGKINILFSTTGGSVGDGLTMYEAIKRSKNPVHLTVTGAAESIGAFIVQAAHVRKIEPTAYIMYHSGTFQTQETAVDEVVREAMFTRDQYRMIDKLMYDRIKPKISLDAYFELVRKSIWLDAKASLKAGYVDEIV